MKGHKILAKVSISKYDNRQIILRDNSLMCKRVADRDREYKEEILWICKWNFYGNCLLHRR